MIGDGFPLSSQYSLIFIFQRFQHLVVDFCHFFFCQCLFRIQILQAEGDGLLAFFHVLAFIDVKDMDFFQPFAACCFDDVLKLAGRCLFVYNKRDVPCNRRILRNWCIRDLRYIQSEELCAGPVQTHTCRSGPALFQLTDAAGR